MSLCYRASPFPRHGTQLVAPATRVAAGRPDVINGRRLPQRRLITLDVITLSHREQLLIARSARPRAGCLSVSVTRSFSAGVFWLHLSPSPPDSVPVRLLSDLNLLQPNDNEEIVSFVRSSFIASMQVYGSQVGENDTSEFFLLIWVLTVRKRKGDYIIVVFYTSHLKNHFRGRCPYG